MVVDRFSEALTATPAVAIVRSPLRDPVGAVIDTLAGAGLRCIEVSLTTPGALDEIAAARSRLDSSVVVGAGTVLDSEAALAAVSAGAEFLVTPAVLPEVVDGPGGDSVPVLMGGFSATEVLAAHRSGAWAVKVFPASVGGPSYLKALREPLPNVGLVPTGGIEIDSIGEWLSLGARAVGLSSSLVGDACSGGSLAALAERGRKVVRELGSIP